MDLYLPFEEGIYVPILFGLMGFICRKVPSIDEAQPRLWRRDAPTETSAGATGWAALSA